jgi:hypothetical protein
MQCTARVTTQFTGAKVEASDEAALTKLDIVVHDPRCRPSDAMVGWCAGISRDLKQTCQARMMTASSQCVKGARLTLGSSWLHHLPPAQEHF